jgi:hypothetical protein
LSPALIAIAATTVPLILLGVVCGLSFRAWVALGVAIVAFGVGISLDILVFSDLWTLPAATGLGDSLVLLGLWSILGATVRLGGPLSLKGPPVVVAMLAGALLGELPAAALLSAGARSPAGAARLALAAAAGGMVGRVGDPALLLLGGDEPMILLQLLPLAIVLGVMAAPRQDDLPQTEASFGPRLWLLCAVAAAAAVPGWTHWAVGAGILGSLFLGRQRLREIDLKPVVWVGSAAALGVIAVAGGAPELGATGLERIGEELGEWGPIGLSLAAALLAALTDGTAASICVVGLLDRAMSLNIDGARLALTAGLAVGGLGPLVVAGALRAGWKRWFLQVVVTVIYVGLVLK